MSESTLEELFINATEAFSETQSEVLLRALNDEVGLIQTDTVSESIQFMLESWEENLNPVRAEFIVALAGLEPADTHILRKFLAEAIRLLLPPYLNKSALLRALGLRDSQVALPEIVLRFKSLRQLKTGVFSWQPDTRTWGIVSNIDEFSGAVGVNALNGSNTYAIPLEKVLSSFKLFSPGVETRKLAPLSAPLRIVAREYLDIARKYCLNELTDEEVKVIACGTLAPNFISPERFEGWWNADAASVISSMGRKPCEARSIQELHLLLEKLADAGRLEFDAEDMDKFRAFFARLKLMPGLKDALFLFETISMLSDHLEPEELGEILSPLKGRIPMWPETLKNVSSGALEVWGKIQVKDMPGAIKATKAVFGENYLAEYALLLPLRCLNQFCEHLDRELLADIIIDSDSCGSDILLWIWKNCKNRTEPLNRLVNIRNVSMALSQRDLPLAWAVAQRELKKHLIDKKDFQLHLLENAGDDVASFVYALQGAKFFLPGEQQSLLVKLSRISEPLRAMIEGGEGKKLMGAARKQSGEDEHAIVAPTPTISSIRSHKALIRELEEIVRVHIPENRESLKTARAHGDFRENAEYDAAKERRNFLSQRRNELEREIITIQPVSFRDVEVGERVVIGSTAILRHSDGSEETFHLVGAWDGNPEKNWLSYKTRLGEEFLGRQVGDKIALPGGGDGHVVAIKTLPDDVVSFLADEI